MAPRLTHCFGGSLSGLRRAAAVALVATAALAAGGAQARTSQPEEAGNSVGSISVNELPREAVGTLSLIADRQLLLLRRPLRQFQANY